MPREVAAGRTQRAEQGAQWLQSQRASEPLKTQFHPGQSAATKYVQYVIYF